MFLSRISRCRAMCPTRLPKQSAVRFLSNQSSSGHSPLGYRHLIKPLAFTLTVCGTSFAGATVWSYENQKNDRRLNLFGNGIGNNMRLPRNRYQSDDYYNKFIQWWKSQSEGFKMFVGIAAVNGLVLLGWRIPQLLPIMNRYFMTSMESKSIRCLPMILSNFSHFSFTHFGLNMIVLYSFANIGGHIFGKENFLALYLSSGVMSSFASYAYKVATVSLNPSLGASGAILGILAATCIERPDIQLMIIFFPFFSFSSATAIKAIVAFDTAGLLFKWGFFDHAAHLGGTLFGIYYSYELKRLISQKQLLIINNWKKFKKLF